MFFLSSPRQNSFGSIGVRAFSLVLLAAPVFAIRFRYR